MKMRCNTFFMYVYIIGGPELTAGVVRRSVSQVYKYMQDQEAPEDVMRRAERFIDAQPPECLNEMMRLFHIETTDVTRLYNPSPALLRKEGREALGATARVLGAVRNGGVH